MKKIAIATAALALLALPSFAFTVAVLDAQHVVDNTARAKSALANLKSKRDAAEKRYKSLEAPLVEKQKKLREQSSVMAADKLKAAEEDFQKDVLAFREKTQQINQEMETENLKARQEIKEISDAVRQAVEAIAKEKQYDLVVPKNFALYSGASVVDITEEALKRTNAILK